MNSNRSTLAVALLVLGVSWPVAAEDWPQWRGPDRSDVSRETGLLQAWPSGGPKRAWMNQECGLGYSGFAIVGERLYTLGEEEGKQFVICLNAANGEALWRQTVGENFNNDWGNGPRTTPTIDQGELFVLSADGNLSCLDTADGKIKWTVSLQKFGGKVPSWGYSESVLVDGERVVCTPGGSEGTVLALRRQDGSKIWQSSQITDQAHYSSIVPATIEGKPQYVQLTPEHVFAVDPESGNLLWQVDWGGRVAVIPTPIVRGNEVYVTSGYGTGSMKVKVENGQAETVWRNKVMKNHHGGVILVGEHLYGHSDDSGWTCQDWASGARVWTDEESLGKGAIGYADGRFYCLDESNGTLVLIEASPEGWKESGRFKLDPQSQRRKPAGRIWVHPTIANGRLYLRDQEIVYCYEIQR